MICMAYMGIWGTKIVWLFFWNGLNPKKAVVVDNGKKYVEPRMIIVYLHFKRCTS